MDEAVIPSACRTPIGSFGGMFKDRTAVDLGAVVIREAIARAGLAPADVGDVIMGCVLQARAGMNVARQAAIKAGVPVEGVKAFAREIAWPCVGGGMGTAMIVEATL